MEYFYREMRRRTGYLMDDGENRPAANGTLILENRKALPDSIIPDRPEL
jgi:deoxyribodipyrimidine photolyase-related protein